MVRLSPRFLDDDNLVQAFKYIRDEISECIIPEKMSCYLNNRGKVVKIKGRADSDPRISWYYDQEKDKAQAVRIEIVFDDGENSESPAI